MDNGNRERVFRNWIMFPVVSIFAVSILITSAINHTSLHSIVETKTKVDQDDVTELIEKKLDKFRKLYPEYDNHKVVLGIGGMKFDRRAEEIANKNGIGLIKVSGDKVEFHTENLKKY